MKKLALAIVSVVLVHADSSWTQFGSDSARTFQVSGDRELTKRSVRKLKLRWTLKLENASKELNSLTVPVVSGGVAVVGGSDDNIFGIDAASGKLLWRKHYSASVTPSQEANWLCPNALTATPVIDGEKKVAYALTSDGQLHTLSLSSGDEVKPAREFIPPFAKTWSLNLFHGAIYTATSQACNKVRSAIYAINAEEGEAKQFLAMRTFGAGIWGRAGVAIDEAGTVFAATGDGIFDPGKEQYPNTVLAVDGSSLKLKDYFTPKNYDYIRKKDLDMGNTSPAVFEYGDKELVAASGKEGVIWLLDSKNMGGSDHMQPLYESPLFANAKGSYFAHGFWGALATYTDKQHRRWLYAPAWGPATDETKFQKVYGDAPAGSVMAFQVTGPDTQPVLTPVWRSVNMSVPEPVVIANGVIYALADGDNIDQNEPGGALLKSTFRATHPSGHAILYALDAETGKVLYSSGNAIPGFAHFSGIAVAGGTVFAVTWDNTVYAFSTR